MLKFRRSGLKTENIVPGGESGKNNADAANNNNNGSNSAANVNEQQRQHLDNRRTSGGDSKISRFGYNVNKSMSEMEMSQKVCSSCFHSIRRFKSLLNGRIMDI